MRMLYASILSSVLFLVLSLPVQANKDQLARAQYMLRQMNAELNQLKSQHQSIVAEKDNIAKEKDRLQKKYDKLTSSSKKNKTAMKGKISEFKELYSAEKVAHTESRKKLAEMSAQKKRLFDIATEQTKTIDLCVSNNQRLYEVNVELLSNYEKKGVWKSISQAEPFSGLTQVEIENLVDDYQYKLDDLRVYPEM